MIANLCKYLLALIMTAKMVDSVTPSFITSMTGFETGSKVLTMTGATQSGDFEYHTATLTFTATFSATPALGLGLNVISSTYTTTTSSHSWAWDLTVATISKTQATVQVNRTTSIVTQAAIRFIAISTS